MIRGFFRLIFYAIVMYLIYVIIRLFQNPGKRRSDSSARGSTQVRGVMVKDEVCSTYLPREDALREVRDGREYFFCSSECRQKFLERKKSA